MYQEFNMHCHKFTNIRFSVLLLSKAILLENLTDKSLSFMPGNFKSISHSTPWSASPSWCWRSVHFDLQVRGDTWEQNCCPAKQNQIFVGNSGTNFLQRMPQQAQNKFTAVASNTQTFKKGKKKKKSGINPKCRNYNKSVPQIIFPSVPYPSSQRIKSALKEKFKHGKNTSCFVIQHKNTIFGGVV